MPRTASSCARSSDRRSRASRSICSNTSSRATSPTGRSPGATARCAHRKVADWLQRSAGERVTEFAELLAYHLGTAAHLAAEAGTLDADLREQALRWLRAASDAARRRLALRKAVRLAEEALALSETDLQRAESLEALGMAHFDGYAGDPGVRGAGGGDRRPGPRRARGRPIDRPSRRARVRASDPMARVDEGPSARRTDGAGADGSRVRQPSTGRRGGTHPTPVVAIGLALRVPERARHGSGDAGVRARGHRGERDRRSARALGSRLGRARHRRRVSLQRRPLRRRQGAARTSRGGDAARDQPAGDRGLPLGGDLDRRGARAVPGRDPARRPRRSPRSAGEARTSRSTRAPGSPPPCG